MEAITQSLVSGVTQIATDATSTIAAIIPVALPVAGIIIVVGIGFKVFKKVAK